MNKKVRIDRIFDINEPLCRLFLDRGGRGIKFIQKIDKSKQYREKYQGRFLSLFLILTSSTTLYV